MSEITLLVKFHSVRAPSDDEQRAISLLRSAYCSMNNELIFCIIRFSSFDVCQAKFFLIKMFDKTQWPNGGTDGLMLNHPFILIINVDVS